MKVPLSVLSVLLVTGCGTAGHIKGRVLDSDGHGIPNAKVTAWRGSFLASIAPVLPERIADGQTDADGRFDIFASKRVHFLSADQHGSADLGFFPVGEIIIKEKRPNQAPEPTPGSVTPRADQSSPK